MINAICLLILIGSVCALIPLWIHIPDQIPMHYNFAGEIDRYGSKGELLVLPVVSWIFYIFLTIIEQFPQIWNTGVAVTPQNREKVYKILLNLLVSLKLLTILVFSFLTFNSALGYSLSPWFLPIFLLLTFGNMGFWLWRLWRAR